MSIEKGSPNKLQAVMLAPYSPYTKFRQLSPVLLSSALMLICLANSRLAVRRIVEEGLPSFAFGTRYDKVHWKGLQADNNIGEAGETLYRESRGRHNGCSLIRLPCQCSNVLKGSELRMSLWKCGNLNPVGKSHRIWLKIIRGP